MKHYSAILFVVSLLISTADSANFRGIMFDSDGYVLCKKEQGGGFEDFRAALKANDPFLVKDVYDAYGLKRELLNEKLEILKEYIANDNIKAVETILTIFQLTEDQLNSFPLVALVKSDEMLDFLVDEYKVNLYPEIENTDIDPETLEFIESKRQELAESEKKNLKWLN